MDYLMRMVKNLKLNQRDIFKLLDMEYLPRLR